MAYIPVQATDLVNIVNLPGDMSSKPLWQFHAPLVQASLAEYLTTEVYADAIDADSDSTSEYYAPVRLAYAFLMLASTLEFLNLKTVGEGIVKTVGLDQSATELLTGSEIEAYKKNLEIRALKSIKPYLSEAGKAKQEELSPHPPRLIRVAVI